MFVRKRDPRFIANSQTEAQRQAALLAASKEQAARQRAENAAKLRNYKAADWTRVSNEAVAELYNSEDLDDEESSAIEGEEEEEEEEAEVIIQRFECIVCKKTFGSEGQMNAHERSKKHIKAIQVLKRQMQKENKEFDLDRDVRGWEKKSDEFTPMDDDAEKKDNLKDKIDEETEELQVGKKPLPAKEPLPTASPPTSPTRSENEDNKDDEYVTHQQFESRILGSTPPTSVPPPFQPGLSETLTNTLNLTSDNEAPKPKIGKAKAKKAKRAAQAATPVDSDSTAATICATCKQSFSSNTKIFNHLRDNPSHAKPVASEGGGGKKEKGKGKRK